MTSLFATSRSSSLLLLAPIFAAGSLVQLEAPPPLNSPVFSLATLDSTGRTNMNILTYASPVGISPRRWVISLFRKTETHANFLRRRTGVLQLLSPCHGPLTYSLGGCSSRDVDKAQCCHANGFEWQQHEGHEELLLPGCAAYYRVTLEGEVIDCGEHDAALCVLDGVFVEEDGVRPDALCTSQLREMGLISDAGRAIAPTA